MANIMFKSHRIGDIIAKNRIVLAPMTRSRSSQPGDIPNGMMGTYYAQRASSGLIITEATQISSQGKGYSFTPGIYTREQVEGWKKITREVHENNGKIFIQLWHVGRMSHPSLHEDGLTYGPSAIATNASVWIVDETGVGGMKECPVPQALSEEQIQVIINDYRLAARNAMEAGFDGIEIHAGNGYLLDEFMRSTSNKRNDQYGGSMANRIRLVIEVFEAIASEIGPEKIGIRLSPHNTARGMDCPYIIPTVLKLIDELDSRKMAYVHFAEADWDNAPEIPLDFRQKVKALFKGTIIVAGNYTKERATKIIEAGLADMVAFGRLYISNPDLPERFKKNLEIEPYNQMYFFGGNEIGYTTYKKID